MGFRLRALRALRRNRPGEVPSREADVTDRRELNLGTRGLAPVRHPRTLAPAEIRRGDGDEQQFDLALSLEDGEELGGSDDGDGIGLEIFGIASNDIVGTCRISAEHLEGIFEV